MEFMNIVVIALNIWVPYIKKLVMKQKDRSNEDLKMNKLYVSNNLMSTFSGVVILTKIEKFGEGELISWNIFPL